VNNEDGRLSRKIILAALTGAIGLVFTVTGCTGDVARPAAKVGVIVSDPAASARWEDVDQPLLNNTMGAEGLAPDVQNSAGDPRRFAAIADGMINEGVKVLVIAAPNNEVSAAVVTTPAPTGWWPANPLTTISVPAR
jgi:ABC-type xylose transport system substrate-binding protein